MPDVREVYEMVTKQKPPEPGALERQQRRQVRTARNRKIGAFAVAAAVGVVALLLFVPPAEDGDSPSPAGRSTQEPREATALGEETIIAERFMAARNDHDVDRAMSFLAQDGADVLLLHDNRIARNMPVFRLDRDELALAFEVERIYGVRYHDVVCRPSPDPVREAQIECSFAMDSRLRRFVGAPPLETSFHVGVDHGAVTFLSIPYLNAGFPGNVPAETWSFIEWVQGEHPDVGRAMQDGTLFHTGGQELTLNLTPEAIELLETYVDEYEEARRGD